MSPDEEWMQRCLELAANGLGHVAPNPMVGCVLVCNRQIIGEGFHAHYGEAHAEVNAIRSVADGSLLRQSTLYVNLEPCAHYGKTPPCAHLIVEKGIKKVIIGSRDPNPLVTGKGIAYLRAHNVEVIEDVLKKECDFLNRRFLTYHTKHRPYIILKWAQSSDGFLAPADTKPYWLTNDASRKLVHQWRSEEQAIMVGKNTVLKDNPQLTVRLCSGKNPIRITLDRDLDLPKQANIFNDAAPCIIFNHHKITTEQNVKWVKIDFNKPVLLQVLADLYERHILSLIVEGGATLLRSFIENNLWDEARVFTVAQKLNSGLAAPSWASSPKQTEWINDDELKIYFN